MDDDSDQAWPGHASKSPLPAGRRRWPWLLLIVVLALVGAGGVYAWPEVAPGPVSVGGAPLNVAPDGMAH